MSEGLQCLQDSTYCVPGLGFEDLGFFEGPGLAEVRTLDLHRAGD